MTKGLRVACYNRTVMLPLKVIQPTASAWDAFISTRPNTSILQTSAWGQLKSRFGWSADRIALQRNDAIVAGALVLFRPLPLRLGTLAYSPRGPLLDLADTELSTALMRALDDLTRRRRAVLLKIEPDTRASASQSDYDERLAHLGFRPSPHIVQPPRTSVIDLTRSEDDILAAMHHKTRYNIRLSARKGVIVREATRSDLPAFNELMRATGSRDGFGVHSSEYYQTAFDLFVEQGTAKLFVAEVESQLVAALFAFTSGKHAWYFYGASGNMHRKLMPNYALQWRTIQWAKSLDCTEYDLWGIPDEDDESLEAQYLNRRDGLWGVYRFKRGFGGKNVRYVGAFDRVYNPLLYRLYLLVLKYRGIE